MSNWEKEEKILGIGIGKRRKRSRGAGRFVPKDGDGDGFYSLGPGLPDETPMVSALVELGEEAFEGVTPADREVSATVAVAKKIEEQVVAKYGPLESQEDQKAALLKAFPNVFSSSLQFFSEQGSLSSVDKKNKRSICIGLLHMADQKPKAAKRIFGINRISESKAHGQCTGTINTGGVYGGIVLRFRSDRDYATLSPNEIRQLARTPYAPWGTVVALGMKKRGNTSEEVNNVFWISVAVHEFSHAIHMDVGLTDAGMEIGDYVPEELSIRGFARAFYGSESPATLRNVKTTVDFKLSNSASRGRQGGRPQPSRNEQVFNQLISMAKDISDSDTGARGTREDRHNAATLRLAEQTMDLQLWDGVPEAKREEIRRQLGKASGYGNTGFTTNPVVQYREGVAETITRREMTGGVFVEIDSDTQSHLRYILTKQEKDPMKKLAKPEEDLLACTGYLSEDENGNPIPVPPPEKLSDFKLTGSDYERFYKTD